MHQNIIGCEFQHRIWTSRAKVPPMAGNMLSWSATAADHSIASFSAISARNGLKLRPFALHAYADGRLDREDGLRNMECTPGGQQPSSSASATLLPRKHRHVKVCIIAVFGRRVGGALEATARVCTWALHCQYHVLSSSVMVCALDSSAVSTRDVSDPVAKTGL